MAQTDKHYALLNEDGTVAQTDVQAAIREWEETRPFDVVQRPTGVWYPETYKQHIERRAERLERLLRRLDKTRDWQGLTQDQRLLQALKDEQKERDNG
jgi:hypothetical protein